VLTAVGAGADGIFQSSIAAGLQVGMKARVNGVSFVNRLKTRFERFPEFLLCRLHVDSPGQFATLWSSGCRRIILPAAAYA